MDWDVIDWGTLEYGCAWERQRSRNLAVSEQRARPAVFLVEHEPVITISRRRGVGEHLLASPEQLQTLGIQVSDTDRGGDITYHGPGQLVAYPILRLDALGLNLGRYMRLLEEVVIQTLAAFGVAGHTEAGATGVWVEMGSGQWGVGSGAQADVPHAPFDGGHRPHKNTAKVCAMGVRVRKHTTMHGLALNVTTDLSHFTTIDPCGLGGRAVTSLAALKADACPSMDEVKSVLVHALAEALDRSAQLKERRSVESPVA